MRHVLITLCSRGLRAVYSGRPALWRRRGQAAGAGIVGMSVLIFLAWMGSDAWADQIFLKDGKVHEGRLIGKSEKRFLFSIDVGGEGLPMSFFPEEVEKIELDEESVERHIPYLKEVDSATFEGRKESYELSLYGQQAQMEGPAVSSRERILASLSEEEAEYHEKFNGTLRKYADKFSKIQDLYLNLTTTTPEELVIAKGYMDSLHFELNNFFVPEAFGGSHRLYLDSVQASILTFDALRTGALDEASTQIGRSDELKQKAMVLFRKVVQARLEQQAVLEKENEEKAPEEKVQDKDTDAS